MARQDKCLYTFLQWLKYIDWTFDYTLMMVFVAVLILTLVIVICNGALITPGFN